MPAFRTRMSPFPIIVLAALICGVFAFPTTTGAVETRTVADVYTVEVGFITEPPIQNESNGLRVRVTEGDTPVEGAESTLTAQVMYAEQPRVLPLVPVAGEPGTYTSVFIPTQPGEYAFHLTGSIGDTAIDETFAPSDAGLPLVASRLDYEFPVSAHGDTSTVTVPVAVGAVLLIAGTIGYVIRRDQ